MWLKVTSHKSSSCQAQLTLSRHLTDDVFTLPDRLNDRQQRSTGKLATWRTGNLITWRCIAPFNFVAAT